MRNRVISETIRCIKMIVAVQLAVFIVGVGMDEANAESWPQFRGPNRNGVSDEKGAFDSIAKTEPTLAWMAEGVGSGYASVSVVGDRVYTTGNVNDAQAVIALSAKDGTVIWKTPISKNRPEHGYGGSRCTPTVDGDKLYVVGSGGNVACLNTEKGDLVWERPFSDWNGKMMSGWGYSESPLVDGDKVICTPGGDKGLMVALDKKTGKEIWTSLIDDTSNDKKQLNDGAGYASAVISNAAGVKQYVQLVGRGVIGVRASDGKLLWRYTGVGNTTANIPTVIAANDYIFCSTAYDTGSALLKLSKEKNNGVKMEEVYFLPAKQLQNKHGGMVMIDGYIYCGHGNGNGLPICVEAKTGKVAWGPVRGEGSGEASIACADGHIIFRFENGVVSIVKANPKKFDVVRTFKPAYQEKESWSYPAVADGKLYLREQDKIMCYSLD